MRYLPPRETGTRRPFCTVYKPSIDTPRPTASSMQHGCAPRRPPFQPAICRNAVRARYGQAGITPVQLNRLSCMASSARHSKPRARAPASQVQRIRYPPSARQTSPFIWCVADLSARCHSVSENLHLLSLNRMHPPTMGPWTLWYSPTRRRGSSTTRHTLRFPLGFTPARKPPSQVRHPLYRAFPTPGKPSSRAAFP